MLRTWPLCHQRSKPSFDCCPITDQAEAVGLRIFCPARTRVELNLAVDRLAQLAEDRLAQLSERMLLPRAASSNVKARSPERKEHVGRARVRRV